MHGLCQVGHDPRAGRIVGQASDMRIIDTLIRRALFHQRSGPGLIGQTAGHIEAEIARER